MKSASAGMIAALAAEVSTLATCWKITRRDAVVLGFTTHIDDLVIDGVTYLADTGAYSPTVVQTAAGMSVDSVDVQSVIDSSAITEDDLRAGRYDYARVEIFQVDYTNTAAGALRLRTGITGEVSEDGITFTAELRGLLQFLQQSIGRYYGKRCDADLGDTRCGVALGPLTVASSVASVASQEQFTGGMAPARHGGLLTWTSGLNAGLSVEIKAVSGVTIALALPTWHPISIGDSYTASPGCDKLRSTCRDIYTNMANFRGFPDIPGPDKANAYPDAK